MKKTVHGFSTGIGSLPFAARDAAMQHVFERYSLPFYPQLPKALVIGRAPGVPPMFAEILPPKESHSALSEPTEERAARQIARWPGLIEFLRRAAATKNRAPWAAKLQIAGPACLAAWLESRGEGRADDLAEPTRIWCAALVRALAKSARVYLPNALILVDDSMMMARAGSEDARWLRALNKDLMTNGVTVGLHGCAEAGLGDVFGAFCGLVLAPDLNVMNMPVHDEDFDAALAAHGEAGGGCIFGVVDTREANFAATQATSQVASAQALLSVINDGRTKRSLTEWPLILSGGCGTGLHAESYERQVAAFLASAAQGQ